MKLQWPGFNDKGTIIIELAPESFCMAKGAINVFSENFTVKDELHITVIGTQLGLIILDKIKYNQAINKLLEKTFEGINWSFKQTGPVHMLSRKKGKTIQKSIIMLLEMPGENEFIQQLKTFGLIDPGTPVPPPHVTMYTQNCSLGIGVPSADALNTLSRKTISVNSLNKLCE